MAIRSSYILDPPLDQGYATATSLPFETKNGVKDAPMPHDATYKIAYQGQSLAQIARFIRLHPIDITTPFVPTGISKGIHTNSIQQLLLKH